MIGGGVVFCLGLVGSSPAQATSSAREAKLEQQIAADLQKDSDLGNDRVDVSVYRGVATLTGTVDTKAERAKAEQLARTDGVSAVDNQLGVGNLGPAAAAISDSAVTVQVRGQLTTDTALKHISVGTRDGVVTLTGRVSSDQARIRALDIARRTPGVAQVEDQLEVSNPAARRW
jgi:osmotically-inducible protein OsmY